MLLSNAYSWTFPQVYILVQILLALPVRAATMEGRGSLLKWNAKEKYQKLIVQWKFCTSHENPHEDPDLE